ncbi:MarR family transcriptional regulator [Nocardia sp. NPDC059246]|uniref:MarR family transcriptional regulator n=1 Tax=Nocardia sp. NPDC059246 TaxID=3346789 RepID=UPI0036B3FE51
MRSRHYAALMGVHENGGLSQSELGALLDTDPSSVTAVVDDLERNGYVRRGPHPTKTWSHLVLSTESGRKLLQHMSNPIAHQSRAILSPLTEQEQTQFLDMLRRLATTDRTPPDHAEPKLVGRPKRADAAQNFERILAASHRLLDTRAFNVTLDEIAAAASVGVGTVYRRFANKRELTYLVVQQYLEELAAQAEKAEQHSDPWQGLSDYVRYVGERIANSVGFGRMGDEIPIGTEQYMFGLDRVEAPLERLLARAKATGQVKENVELIDLRTVFTAIGPVATVFRTVDPNHWRRYLSFALQDIQNDPCREPATAARKACPTTMLPAASTR